MSASLYSCCGGIREALNEDGALYLEVPRGEFVEERAAIYDLATQHTQYFYEPNLLALAGRAGLAAEKRICIRGGHDLGLILKPLSKGSAIDSKPGNAQPSDFEASHPTTNRQKPGGSGWLKRQVGTIWGQLACHFLFKPSPIGPAISSVLRRQPRLLRLRPL